MVVINPAEQFSSRVLFQTPTMLNGQNGFNNYVNLILPTANEQKTTFDGKSLNSIPGVASIERLPILNTGWEAIRFRYDSAKGNGTHIIVSDTGVGVYIYGYGYGESYAWAGNLGVITPNSPDSMPPVAKDNNSSYRTMIHLNDNHPKDSRLSDIQLDSITNMGIVLDPTFIPGAALDSSHYQLYVLDRSKPAYALVSTYDLAGNRTRVESRYAGNSAINFTLSDFDFGCIDVGTSKKVNATTAHNLSPSILTIDSVWVDDPAHFSFTGQSSLPKTLKVDQTLSFEFKYTPLKVEHDTTIAHFHSLEAGTKTAKLIGCGQIPTSVDGNGYVSSLSKGSAEYSEISSRLDHGETIAILPPVPNPLTAEGKSIRFVYGLQSDSPLDLSLYDILGNLIASVVHSEHQSAGIYETDFSIGTNIPSGSYIYRLAGAGRVLSGKLVIAR
jgi:hypothetical protein